MRDHAPKLAHALLVGGDLRLEVGDVLIRVARRPAARGEDRAHFRLAEAALRDQPEVVDEDALLLDRAARRRHRARRRAADIGVVAAAADGEQEIAPGVRSEERRVGKEWVSTV